MSGNEALCSLLPKALKSIVSAVPASIILLTFILGSSPPVDSVVFASPLGVLRSIASKIS